MMIESHHERIDGSERVNSKSPVNELIDKINEMGVEWIWIKISWIQSCKRFSSSI